MDKPVLILINTMANGGAQRQVALCARQLVRLGYSVTIMHHGSNGFATEGLEQQGVRIVRIVGTGKFRNLRAAASYLDWILKHRPQRVISFLDSSNQLCGLFRLLGVRFTWVPSERNLTVSRSRRSSAWRKLLYRRAEFVACNSEAQSAWIRRLGMSRPVITIPNGIAHDLFRERESHARGGEYRFVVLARLGEQKNPWVLVRALKLLQERPGPKLTIHWYGDDDPGAPMLREQLEAEVKNFSLPLKFRHATKDVPAVLDSSDCLILPSLYEGTPNVVLEAMARSLPCIASAVSDVPRILGQGERGWLFRSDDEVELANALVAFMTAPEAEVLAVTDAARRYVQEAFSDRQMALSYVRQLDEQPADQATQYKP